MPIDLYKEYPISMLALKPEDRLRARVLARYQGQPGVKVAAFPPFAKQGPPIPPDGGSSKRNIPTDHAYNPQALKPLSRMLWAMSVALGHALTAYRQFTKVKSSTISPDGMLGGRGYIMPVRDIRQKLYDACESLSAISDTIHDEINGPHWGPKMAQLDPNDAEDVRRFVEESQEILANPEEEAEEDMEAIEKENDGSDDDDDEEESSSELPVGGETEEDTPMMGRPKEAAYSYFRANSSLPVDSLPGPRVDHLGPAEGQGPSGSFNQDDPRVTDDWGLNDSRREPGLDGYDYPSPWENGHHAHSVLPEDLDTDTEAWDFGLGYGASGQGAGGYETPSDEGNGKGVFGPTSELPRASQTVLPTDVEPPVARSDYYTQGLNDHAGQSVLPQDAAPAIDYTYDRDLPNTGEVQEHHDGPYIRYDYTTKNYRPDFNFSEPKDKAFSQ